jgi:hypothetical protein
MAPGNRKFAEHSPRDESPDAGEDRRNLRPNDEEDEERPGPGPAGGPPGRYGYEYNYRFAPLGRGGPPPGYPPHMAGRGMPMPMPPPPDGDYYNPYHRRGPAPPGAGGPPPYGGGGRGRPKSSIPPGRYTLGGMGPERDPGAPPSARPPPGWEHSREPTRSGEESESSDTESVDDRRPQNGSPPRGPDSSGGERRPEEDSPSDRSESKGGEIPEAERDRWEAERGERGGHGPPPYGRYPPGYFPGLGGPRGAPPPGAKGGPYRGGPPPPPYDHPAYRYPPGMPPDYYSDPYFYGPPPGAEYGEYPPPPYARGPGGFPYPRPVRPSSGEDRERDRERESNSDRGGSFDEYDYPPPPSPHHPAAAEYYARMGGRGPPPRRGPPPGYPPMAGPYGGRYPPMHGPSAGMRPPFARGRSNDSGEEAGPPPYGRPFIPPYAYPYPHPHPHRRAPSAGSSGDDNSDEQRPPSAEVESPKRSSRNIQKSAASRGDDNDDTKSEPDRVYCTCKKSRCLKLYCQCFASRQTCQMTASDEKGNARCRCSDCKNNTQFDDERLGAIATLLVRNPSAFDTKIREVAGEGADAGDAEQLGHKVGCKCRRSACLKKYCECYNAKVSCSTNCRCVGCKNTDTGPPSEGLEDSSASETHAIRSYHGSPSRGAPPFFHQAAMRYGRGGPGPGPYQAIPPPHHPYDYHGGRALPPPYGSPSRGPPPYAVSQRKTRPGGGVVVVGGGGGSHAQMVEDAAKNLTQLKQSPTQKSDHSGEEEYTSPGTTTVEGHGGERAPAVTNSRGNRTNEDTMPTGRMDLPNTPEKNKLSIPSLSEQDSPRVSESTSKTSNKSKDKAHDEGSAGKKGGNSLMMAAMAMTELLGGKGSRPASPSKDSNHSSAPTTSTSNSNQEDEDVEGKERENKAEAEETTTEVSEKARKQDETKTGSKIGDKKEESAAQAPTTEDKSVKPAKDSREEVSLKPAKDSKEEVSPKSAEDSKEKVSAKSAEDSKEKVSAKSAEDSKDTHPIQMDVDESSAKSDTKDMQAKDNDEERKEKVVNMNAATSTPPASPKGPKAATASATRRMSPRKRKVSDSDLLASAPSDSNKEDANATSAKRGKRDRTPVLYTK